MGEKYTFSIPDKKGGAFKFKHRLIDRKTSNLQILKFRHKMLTHLVEKKKMILQNQNETKETNEKTYSLGSDDMNIEKNNIEMQNKTNKNNEKNIEIIRQREEKMKENELYVNEHTLEELLYEQEVFCKRVEFEREKNNSKNLKKLTLAPEEKITKNDKNKFFYSYHIGNMSIDWRFKSPKTKSFVLQKHLKFLKNQVSQLQYKPENEELLKPYRSNIELLENILSNVDSEEQLLKKLNELNFVDNSFFKDDMKKPKEN